MEHTVVWLNVNLEQLQKRKRNEGKERPIVYPSGIVTFEDLHSERVKLYKEYANITVNVSSMETPAQTVHRIIQKLRRF